MTPPGRRPPDPDRPGDGAYELGPREDYELVLDSAGKSIKLGLDS
jgi:hypothetical protein